MKLIIKKAINLIQKLVNDGTFKLQRKRKETDFIRNRKINFSDIVIFVSGLSNTSFDFERINFCHVASIESVSNAILSKARDKVNFSAFRELLVHTQKLIPATAGFKGCRVIVAGGERTAATGQEERIIPARKGSPD